MDKGSIELRIMMENVTRHSLLRAADEAVKLWSLSSTQYPMDHKLLLDLTETLIIETISNFALNARRAMELLPVNEKFSLSQPRYLWKPLDKGEIVNDLRDALNRIVHAKKLNVGFLGFPAKLSDIEAGAIVIPYVKAETDRRSEAYIDTFALSHAFLYFVYPKLNALNAHDVSETIH